MANSFEEQKDKLLGMYPELFPTEAKFWAFLRGCLRRGLWEKSPMKLSFKSQTSSPPPEGYTGRGRKGHTCALTGEWVSVSNSEVDHKEGGAKLSSEEQIIPFIVHMLASKEELQVVDKEAHKIKSYAEAQGIPFKEAVATKKAIAVQNAKKDKDVLVEAGIPPASNAKGRREQLKALFMREG